MAIWIPLEWCAKTLEPDHGVVGLYGFQAFRSVAWAATAFDYGIGAA
ncbi:hypothetical protein [Ralstonia pseudosolanacearum]|nr:hypothetical protein KME70_02340 [Ralstonia solanacearum]